MVIFTGWLMIMIVSWAMENNFDYFRFILAGYVIVIVSRAIENNLIYFDYSVIVSWAIGE